jgi:disulfide bond formation protein DsbB
MATEQIRRNPAAAAAVVVAAGGAATILGAWYFQYGVGLAPCPLCLEQRIPYYLAIPLAAVVALAAGRRWPRSLLGAGLLLIAAILLWGAGLAIYHAGVEWHWWAGPQDCATPAASLGGGNLLRQMQTARVVRCDEAAWRFLGLSLAGWNALIALALAAVALAGAALAVRPRGPGSYGSSSVSQYK